MNIASVFNKLIGSMFDRQGTLHNQGSTSCNVKRRAQTQSPDLREDNMSKVHMSHMSTIDSFKQNSTTWEGWKPKRHCGSS